MKRRHFLRRMASAVVGVGLLGSELMARVPAVNEQTWLDDVRVGTTHTVTWGPWRGSGAVVTDIDLERGIITLASQEESR